MKFRIAIGAAAVALALTASSQDLAGQSSGLSRVFEINRQLLA